ncbi:MAG: methionyl-tRNA formyltransferase [Bacteroidales bacterium]|nr:methionyl-tRNA formyltransferase [Bacteroidales bacterium]
MKKLRIIFMGTPEFAVSSLKILVENNYNVAGVVTTPDKPAGRGQKIRQSAVKEYAIERNIAILQPDNLKDTDFIKSLKELNPDIQIIVAFRMLPEAVWKIPEYGTFNLHASLLPQYRGAAPINWAIINGESVTGVTTFFIDNKIDTGNIIFQEKVSINETDNAEMLHDKLMNKGAELVKKTVDAIENKNINIINQKELIKDINNLKNAPKIFKDDCKIDWNKSVKNIYNLIRGLSPYPGAWTEFISKDNKIMLLKIFSSEIISIRHNQKIGTFQTNNKDYLKVFVKNACISIKELQVSGKKRLKIDEFLRGFKGIENFTVNL